MNSKRLRTIMLGLIGFSALLFVIICGLGLSSLKTKSQSVSKLKLDSRVADDQLASLAQAKGQIAKYAYFKDVAKTVLPTDKDQASAILDLFQLADESGISIQTIAFPNSTLGVGSIASISGTAPVSAVGATAKDLLSQAKPVTGIPGLYSVQLIISFEFGDNVSADKRPTYPKLIDFLNRVENDRRTAQIAQVSILAQDDRIVTPYINFGLTINIFIRP
jgi:hypothetical protein